MRQKKILDVFTIIYKGKQKIGFKVEGMDKNLFLSPKNVKQCTGVSLTEVEILVDSTIRPEFYKEGEEMFNGQIFFKGDALIIKDFWIEASNSYENMRKAHADKLKDFKEIQKVFIFNRNDKDIIGFEIGEEKAVFVPATGYFKSYDNNDSRYDSSDWLADAAGSDDPEVMSDAYWNMD